MTKDDTIISSRDDPLIVSSRKHNSVKLALKFEPHCENSLFVKLNFSENCQVKMQSFSFEVKLKI